MLNEISWARFVRPTRSKSHMGGMVGAGALRNKTSVKELSPGRNLSMQLMTLVALGLAWGGLETRGAERISRRRRPATMASAGFDYEARAGFRPIARHGLQGIVRAQHPSFDRQKKKPRVAAAGCWELVVTGTHSGPVRGRDARICRASWSGSLCGRPLRYDFGRRTAIARHAPGREDQARPIGDRRVKPRGGTLIAGSVDFDAITALSDSCATQGLPLGHVKVSLTFRKMEVFSLSGQARSRRSFRKWCVIAGLACDRVSFVMA